jgi:hypothetical protein
MSRHKALKGMVAESYYDDEGDYDDYGGDYPPKKSKKAAKHDDYGDEDMPEGDLKKKKLKGPKRGRVLAFIYSYRHFRARREGA